MTNSAFGKQVANRNFLSGVAFKFSLTKFPKVDFFGNNVVYNLYVLYRILHTLHCD